MRLKTADFQPRDSRDCHAQTGSGQDTKFTASVVQLLNSYTRFQACSYYSLEVMRDLKQSFSLCAKWALFLKSTHKIGMYCVGSRISDVQASCILNFM